MFKNFIKTGVRNLIKYKTFSLLNVFGLALGLACTLVVFLQVQHDLSFESHHQNRDRIYRINMINYHENVTQPDPGTPFAMPKALREEYPDVEAVAMLVWYGGVELAKPQSPKKIIEQKDVVFSDHNIFDLFTVEWIAGNPAKALTGLHELVITRSMANKFFRNMPLDQVVGETLLISGGEKTQVTITGIIEDTPTNTDFPWTMIASIDLQEELNPFYDATDFDNVMSEAQTFVLLQESFNISLWEEQLVGFTDKYLTEEGDKTLKLSLQPLNSIHYDTRYETFTGQPVSYKAIASKAGIALLILIIAIVNFVNLSTAQSVHRLKEIGVRKVLGGEKRQIMGQFFAETFIIVLIAGLLSLVLAELLIMQVGDIIQFPDDLSIINSPIVIPFLLSIILITTILGGIYPAWMAARYEPSQALRKGKVKGGNLALRNGLVIFQFAITQVLIIATLIALRQLDYFQQKPLGFDREGIINVRTGSADSTQLTLIKQLWSAHPFVESVSVNSSSPTGSLNIESRFGYPATNQNRDYQANIKVIDEAYLDTYGLRMLAGEDLKYRPGVAEVIVNETTTKVIGYDNPADAVGDALNIMGGNHKIVGVTKDFHVSSLHEEVDPAVLVYYNAYIQNAGVKFRDADDITDKRQMAILEEEFNKVLPARLFDYKVYEEYLKEHYQDEKKTADLLTIMAAVAILIGCLGLYGLIAFLAAQKTKEIGIRKVLGASISQIIIFFSKQFIYLIGIAFIIAAPLGYYAMQQWLDDFYYRITITADIFLVAIGGSLLLGMITVFYRAYRAASVNPVNSLKDE